jgi:hypothetical protein
MTAELTAIKTAYEDEGMTPQEISDSQELQVDAVKAGLMQCSSKYRKACGTEPENENRLNYTEDEQARVKEMILDLALGAEDPHLRAKMATYVRDDAKGRKDVVKGMAGNNFNILFINKQLERARQVTTGIKQRILGSGVQKECVDV